MTPRDVLLVALAFAVLGAVAGVALFLWPISNR